MEARERRRWETALGLFCVAWFLACEGTGHRVPDVEGSWQGTAEDKRRETTYDLGLSIDRDEDETDELSASVTLDGETVEAYRVESGSRRTVRIWYEFPSGRRGRVRGRVNNSGYLMRGVLRLEEGSAVYAPRFELDSGYSARRPAPEKPAPAATPAEPEVPETPPRGSPGADASYEEGESTPPAVDGKDTDVPPPGAGPSDGPAEPGEAPAKR